MAASINQNMKDVDCVRRQGEKIIEEGYKVFQRNECELEKLKQAICCGFEEKVSDYRKSSHCGFTIKSSSCELMVVFLWINGRLENIYTWAVLELGCLPRTKPITMSIPCHFSGCHWWPWLRYIPTYFYGDRLKQVFYFIFKNAELCREKTAILCRINEMINQNKKATHNHKCKIQNILCEAKNVTARANQLLQYSHNVDIASESRNMLNDLTSVKTTTFPCLELGKYKLCKQGKRVHHWQYLLTRQSTIFWSYIAWFCHLKLW